MESIIKLFSRNTASTRFIPEIDGLRFFAIFTVLLYHLNTAFTKEINLDLKQSFVFLGDEIFYLGWFLKRFDIGVKVFFAISGFILAVPFWKYYLGFSEKVSIKKYFLRRLTRLEPPFIISMVGFYIVHLFVFKADYLDYLKRLVMGIFYSHTWFYGEPNPINPVSWSLETEAQFYILVPLFFFFLSKIKKRLFLYLTLILFFIASVLMKNQVVESWNPHLIYTILNYFINFFIGIIISFFYLTHKSFFQTKFFIWDILGIVAFLLMFYFYKPQKEITNILMLNVGILILFLSVFKGKITNYFYTLPVIYTIGGMCYSIYLLHFAFFHLSIKFTSKLMLFEPYSWNYLIQVLINIPLVLMVSGIFYLLFEKPFMNKK